MIKVGKLFTLAIIISLSLTSCASKPAQPSEPPRSPPVPNLTSPNGHIKAVGTLPEIQAYAQAYWTADNRLFVMGDTIGGRVWEQYYRKQYPELAHWEGHIPERYEAMYSFLPIWDPKTNKSEPVRGYLHYRKTNDPRDPYCSQLSDKRIACYAPSADKGDPTKGELYDPVIGSSTLLPAIEANKGFGETTSNNKLLVIDWSPALMYTLGTKKGLTVHILELDPLTAQYKSLMDLYPTHVGFPTIMTDSQNLVFAGGYCFDKDQEKEILAQADFGSIQPILSDCNNIEVINLKSKTREIVGKLVRIPYSERKNRTIKNSAKLTSNGGYTIALDANRILIWGGANPTIGYYGGEHDQIELFDLNKKKSRVVATLPSLVQHREIISTAVRMSDGSIVLLGERLYLFDQKSEKLIDVDRLIIPRGRYGVAVSPDDKVYIAGGASREGDARVIEMFDYAKYKKEFLNKNTEVKGAA